MSKFWTVAAAITVAAAMCIAVTASAAPSTLNVEGQLIGSDGVPLATGTFTLSVGLYDSAEAGAPVFAETQADVDVIGSVFGMTLGTDLINPLTADMFAQADNLWVGVTIIGGPGIDDPEPELPRAPLGAAPYAYAAHRLVCDACIVGSQIAPATVTGSHIAPASIGASHFAPGSVVAGVNGASGDVHLSAGAGIALDTSGSTITISATGMMGGGEPGAGVPTLTAATLGSLTVADDDIVRVQGTITLSQDLNLFNKDRLHVHGGEFEGTGTQEIDLGSDTVVTGTHFTDLVLDGNSITFIGCTFSGAIGFPFDARIYSSEFNGVTAAG